MTDLLCKVKRVLDEKYGGDIKAYREALNSLRDSQNKLNAKYGNYQFTPFSTNDINRQELALDIIERGNRR